MTSGPPPNLKRPWEVESGSPPHKILREPALLEKGREHSYRHGQDISGWYFEGSVGPWNQAGAIGRHVPLELPPKRSRTNFEQDGGHSMPRATHFSASGPLHVGEDFRPHHASALGPVLSLGYMPGAPPSPKGSFISHHQGRQTPVLPSPSSMPGSGITVQPARPSLPPLPGADPSSLCEDPPKQSVGPGDVQLAQLQAIHEKLQKDYERTKTRLITYDRKSKAADEELAILHEEKFALQDRVATLEKELDETRQQKTDVQDLHNREGAQWRQIISLSNTIQKQHTEQAEKWKEEKGEMTGKIELLEEQVLAMRMASVSGSMRNNSSQVGQEEDGLYYRDDIVGGAFLSREIKRMRMQEEQARSRLREVQRGSTQLKGLLEDLVNTAKGVMDKIDDKPEEDNASTVHRTSTD